MKPARGLRVALILARFEALLLIRNVLVLAGMLAGGALIWSYIQPGEPLWWNAAWQIGYGQVVLAISVLIAAQLAAGRARRDAMTDLYDSFPVPAGTRVTAHLIALAGAAPASLVLIGGSAAVLVSRGAIGAPSPAVVAGGLVLVIAAGAAGIALAQRFAHPLAGVPAALALIALFTQSSQFPGGLAWLSPWTVPAQLQFLPGPLAGYPPAPAHLAELAGITALAGVTALMTAVARPWRRIRLVTVGAVAAAVTCAAGAIQLAPIPAADLNHLVGEAADPSSAEQCTTASTVRYCLYPDFSPLLPALRAPVSAVLARLPARPAHGLTVMQATGLSLQDPALTHGQAAARLATWNARLAIGPVFAPSASTIYVTVGTTSSGPRLADTQFYVALTTAEWALGLPPNAGSSPWSPSPESPCVPLDQAREAIAIWLATQATHVPAAELAAGMPAPDSGPKSLVEVGGTRAVAWDYPGMPSYKVSPEGFVFGDPTSPGARLTAAGYLLAKAMTSLPAAKVTAVLDGAWGTWRNWRTTDARLAAALGMPMPSVPAPTGIAPPRSPRDPGNGVPGTADSVELSPLCTIGP